MNANQRVQTEHEIKEKNFFLGLTQCDIKKLGYSNNLIYIYINVCFFSQVLLCIILRLSLFLNANEKMIEKNKGI